ncbi:hypothetical protein [Kiloniella laminariae]|nr:hypothetical protein [Kiloniella laminariae]
MQYLTGKGDIGAAAYQRLSAPEKILVIQQAKQFGAGSVHDSL